MPNPSTIQWDDERLQPFLGTDGYYAAKDLVAALSVAEAERDRLASVVHHIEQENTYLREEFRAAVQKECCDVMEECARLAAENARLKAELESRLDEYQGMLLPEEPR